MKKLYSLFKLVRWPNLLITALMMCLVYHCVMLMKGSVEFTLLVISMVFIVAAGYVINDVFDMETDAINKPEKQIVGKVFTEKQSRIFYWVLEIIGLACALASSIMAHGPKFYMVFICMALLSAVLYSYSKTYKKKLLVGNVIVSLSVAFAVFLPWLFVMIGLSENLLLLHANEDMMTISLRIVLVYTAFAFFTTLIREIIKDMEDVDGDGRTHCRTIPVVWNMKVASIIASVLVFLLSGSTLALKTYVENLNVAKPATVMMEAIFVLAIAVFVSLIMVGKQMLKNQEKTLHFSSIIMKIIMLIGVLSMIFINLK